MWFRVVVIAFRNSIRVLRVCEHVLTRRVDRCARVLRHYVMPIVFAFFGRARCQPGGRYIPFLRWVGGGRDLKLRGATLSLLSCLNFIGNLLRLNISVRNT